MLLLLLCCWGCDDAMGGTDSNESGSAIILLFCRANLFKTNALYSPPTTYVEYIPEGGLWKCVSGPFKLFCGLNSSSAAAKKCPYLDTHIKSNFDGLSIQFGPPPPQMLSPSNRLFTIPSNERGLFYDPLSLHLYNYDHSFSWVVARKCEKLKLKPN